MTQRTHNLPEEQLGPAERLLGLVLNSSAHLWHSRVGVVDDNGKWQPARQKGGGRVEGPHVKPGLFVPAAVELYGQLLDIYQINAELMAHFASYALLKTEWRDLKVACAALMLVQSRWGEPTLEDDGTVSFYDDDYRTIGEAMILHYEKDSKTMLTPKAVLRVAQLLEVPEIAALNRAAGFADPGSKKPPLGRWTSAAKQWLAFRESNPRLLNGLALAGMKETVKKIARKAGYRPQSQLFFEILGWAQKQSSQGHREVGLDGLDLRKTERFDGLTEEQICDRIVKQKLGYKETVGRLPAATGLTPAIMMTLLPSLSERDLRLLTPTLEALGLLKIPEVRTRWETAIHNATDQRALNIAKNVRSHVLREKLEEAADVAARKAVAEATRELDVEVMFLIDKSGSMQGAIDQAKEALSRILAGFPPEKLHIASFDTMGQVLRPKAPTRKAVEKMLKGIKAVGGTQHGAGVIALHGDGFRVGPDATLVVIVVGDEAGESGERLAKLFRDLGYDVAAMALIVCKSEWARGSTVRDCAADLEVPFSEISGEDFDDPYQVPRALRALLDAPKLRHSGSRSNWIDEVMNTPLLEKPL